MCAYIIEGACIAIFDSWLYLDLELPVVQALKLVNASNTTVLLTWSLPNTSVPVLYYLVSPVGGGGGGVASLKSPRACALCWVTHCTQITSACHTH